MNTARASAGRQALNVSAAYVPTNFKFGSHQEDEYPSPDWIEFCREEFKNGGEGMATLEEARTLFGDEIGYQLLDVRSDYELDLNGKVGNRRANPPVRESLHAPIFQVKKSIDQATFQLVLDPTPNPNFMATLQKLIPKKDTGVVIMDSDSLNRSIQVAIMMEAAGYTNICIMQWGYNGFTNKFTNKLTRRRSDGYKENNDQGAQGSDSAGIHSSGAGFARMDAIDKIQIKDPIEWPDYQ
jgi:hypothetical protein